jgi:2-haloacid dehalogenase
VSGAPKLFTFDVFGTVVDWRRGLTEALARVGHALGAEEFDAIIDTQARDEQARFRSYSDITADSVAGKLGVTPAQAARIGAELGDWPLFDDSAEALRRLMRVAPCAALTNSDRAHGAKVQENLGFELSHWICAEDIGAYKPSLEFWRAAGGRLGMPLDKSWWHVSAYADFDLQPARELGLTTVFVARPHSRKGAADITVPTLQDLAEMGDFAI